MLRSNVRDLRAQETGRGLLAFRFHLHAYELIPLSLKFLNDHFVFNFDL